MAKKVKCEIPGCTDEVVSAGLCSACYAGMRYWLDKTPARVMKRRKQLDRIQARLDVMQGVSSVKPKQRRRRRAA